MTAFDPDQPPEPVTERPNGIALETAQPTPPQQNAVPLDRRLQVPLLLLIGLYAGFAATITMGIWRAFTTVPNPGLAAILLGLVAQAAMLSGAGLIVVLATLHRGPLWLRWLLGSAALGSLPVCFAFGISLGGWGVIFGMGPRIFLAFVLAPAILMMAQLPVWVASQLHNARRGGRRFGDAPASSGGRFRIRDVMIVTTMVAVSLALFKVGVTDVSPEEVLLGLVIYGCIAFALSLLMAVPCTLAALAVRRLWFGGLLLLGYFTTVTTVLALVFCIGFRNDLLETALLAGLLLVAVGTLYGSLLLIRRCNRAGVDHVDPPHQQCDP